MQIWPGKRRLAFAVVIISGLSCAGTWGYTAYLARRAASMLAEASRVRIGDSEASVLSLVGRYGGHKWSEPSSTRGTLGPREGWVDPEEYDRALKIYPDYSYSIEVNPWGFPTFTPSSNAAKALRSAINEIPRSIRAAMGLRDWAAFVDIDIRDGHVLQTGGIVLVEGRSRWLNHAWSLAAERRHELPPYPPYVFEPDNILMEERSRGTRCLVTPQASEEQMEAARSWNTGCIVSLRGCSNRCELSPRAFAYRKEHPDGSGATWEPSCE